MSEALQATHIRRQQHAGVTWVDAENPSSAELEQLEREFELHPLHVRESLQPVQHIAVEREKNYLFFVLRGPRSISHTHKILISQVGVFLGKDYMLTIHSAASPFVTEVWQQGEHGSADYYDHGAGSLLYVLINRLLIQLGLLTDGVMDELDAMEDVVFDSSESDAERISRLRQKIVRLSRIIGPKQFVLQDLAEQIGDFTGKGVAMQKYYASNTRLVNRLQGVISEAKETVEIFKDADFTTSTEQTNRTLAVLTVIFTFSIPATVIAALYGMNVPLPGGVTARTWTFFGEYTTFILAVVLSVLAALAMWWYFRKKRWF